MGFQPVKVMNLGVRLAVKPTESTAQSPTNGCGAGAFEKMDAHANEDKEDSFEVTDYGFLRNTATNTFQMRHSLPQSQPKTDYIQNNDLSPIDFKGHVQRASYNISKKDHFGLEGSDSCLDEEAETNEHTEYTLAKQRNSMSESGKGCLIHNFSASVSPQHTLVVDSHSPSFKSKEKPKTHSHLSSRIADIKAIRAGQEYERKPTCKTLSKIQEAKMIANIYNDQVIKQVQFNKEDEDEEKNFLELCDAFNGHL